jgi:hypothetical protein
MTARRALEDQSILAKLIAQFVDMKSAEHGADCYDTAAARPSSTKTKGTLYKTDSSPLAESRRRLDQDRHSDVQPSRLRRPPNLGTRIIPHVAKTPTGMLGPSFCIRFIALSTIGFAVVAM